LFLLNRAPSPLKEFGSVAGRQTQTLSGEMELCCGEEMELCGEMELCCGEIGLSCGGIGRCCGVI